MGGTCSKSSATLHALEVPVQTKIVLASKVSSPSLPTDDTEFPCVVGEACDHGSETNGQAEMYAYCPDHNYKRFEELQEKGYEVYSWKGHDVKLRKRRTNLSDHRFASVGAVWILYVGRPCEKARLGAIRICTDTRITRDVTSANFASLTLSLNSGHELYMSNGATYRVSYEEPAE